MASYSSTHPFYADSDTSDSAHVFQVRHHIKGWHLDVAHDFTQGKPAVTLMKQLQHASIAASYDFAGSEGSLEYSRPGIRVSAKMSNVRGAGWKKPSLNLYLEPLTLL